MKDNFENPEKTRLVYRIAIEKRQKRLILAQRALEEKGEDATAPDRMAVYSAQVALDMVLNSSAKFEEELAKRQKETEPGE